MKQIVSCAVRVDPAGDGRYHARRAGGSRLHDGIDFLCMPNAPVVSDIDGTVSKLGYAYSDDLDWKYLEITDSRNYRHRYFYVTHGLAVGDSVKRFQPIGLAQNAKGADQLCPVFRRAAVFGQPRLDHPDLADQIRVRACCRMCTTRCLMRLERT